MQYNHGDRNGGHLIGYGGLIGICVHKTRRLEKEPVPIPVKFMQFGLFLNFE